jgi:K+-sensing histidine kinase KdpD
MKYADPHSYVRLECSFERSSGRAAMKVKSYGEPIHPSERESIFTKYKRGTVIERTGRHHSGVGLGLWVARELLAAVDGEISVELSPSDPRLSVFVVHLPSRALDLKTA